MINNIEILDPYGFIYMTTNMINGKKYIGQKKLDTGSRWKSYLGSGYHLMMSIKKYGKENFSREIIAIAYSFDQLNELEHKFINYHNAVESEDYYNKIDGGEVIPSYKRTHSIKVICIDNGKIFESLVDAAIFCNCSTTKITNSLKMKHTYNYKNEFPIFRKLSYLKKGFILCKICGKNINKKDHIKICVKCKEIIKTQRKEVKENPKEYKEKIKQELIKKQKKNAREKRKKSKSKIKNGLINNK